MQLQYQSDNCCLSVWPAWPRYHPGRQENQYRNEQGEMYMFNSSHEIYDG